MLTEEPGPGACGGGRYLVSAHAQLQLRPGRVVPRPGRPVLVVRVHGSEGALLHAVHRPPGHGVAGLALADLAEQGGREPGVGHQLVDLAGGFPDAPQNPYDDPMSYTDGYGLPRGTEAYWGNGDGRFFYPPESAATPGRNGGKPVLEPPVSSLRREMLREGVEDYEFLHPAERPAGAAAATVSIAPR